MSDGGRPRPAAPPSLTIACPTFNRRDAVARLCAPLAAVVEPGRLEVLVVDDGSTDGTAEALADLATPGLRIVSHAANEGYPHAFLTLLRESRSDYVLFVNDDDVVELDALPRLVQFLDARAPDLVRTVHGQADVVGMGPVHPTGPLQPEEFRDAASHNPGLVVRTAAAHEAAPLLDDLVAEGNVAALMYPQVVIAAWVLSRGPGWWWNDRVVDEAEELPSGLVDHAGRPYWAPAARVEQALGYVEVLVRLEAALPPREPRRIAERLRRRHLRTLYPALRQAVAEHDAGLSTGALDRATARQMVAGWLRRWRRSRGGTP